MLGELAEINKVFAVGDTYNFVIEQFRGTPDTNLNKLIGFFDELESLMNSMANINGWQPRYQLTGIFIYFPTLPFITYCKTV